MMATMQRGKGGWGYTYMIRWQLLQVEGPRCRAATKLTDSGGALATKAASLGPTSHVLPGCTWRPTCWEKVGLEHQTSEAGQMSCLPMRFTNVGHDFTTKFLVHSVSKCSPHVVPCGQGAQWVVNLLSLGPLGCMSSGTLVEEIYQMSQFICMSIRCDP